MKTTATLILLAACALQAPAQAQDPRVWLDTGHGPIIVELDPNAAPVTVENFLRYVDDGFYDGVVFHRAASDFVVQGGGFDRNLEYKEPTYDDIVNEADNGLQNDRGTIGMARSNAPDSANSQFFINVSDNDDLNPGGNTDAGFAVFGQVVLGMDVVDEMAELPVASLNVSLGRLTEFPPDTPVIRRAVRVDQGFPIMPDHSGSWYDADNGGVGFNVEFANNSAGQGPIALVYWYNFDQQRQFWLTGQAGFDWGDSEVTVDLFSHPGDDEGTGFQNPPESGFSDYGTLTLSFDGCTAGTFSYDMPGYGSGSIDVTRLSQPDGYRCQDN